MNRRRKGRVHGRRRRSLHKRPKPGRPVGAEREVWPDALGVPSRSAEDHTITPTTNVPAILFRMT